MERCLIRMVDAEDFLTNLSERRIRQKYDCVSIRKDAYTKVPRVCVFDGSNDFSFLNVSKNYPKWFSRLEELLTESKAGRIGYEAVDRELFSAVLDIGSLWIDRHAGLDEEVKRVRRQFPSKLSAPGKVVAGITRGVNRLDENMVSTAGAAERVLAEAARMEERGGQTAGLSL